MIKRSVKKSRSGEKTIKRLKKKLDIIAIEQLRSEVASLSTQLEQAETAIIYAEENAGFWHDQVMSLDEQMSETNCSLGITKSGEMVVVKH